MQSNFNDEFLNIETPENVAFGFEIAGIGSRFLAALVDTAILILLISLVDVTSFLLLQNTLRDLLGESFGAWITGLFGLLSFLFLWGYYILFELSWNGQSPGKRWVGLRVVRTDGTAISLVESAIRNLVRLIDFLPLFYGAGLVTMFINSQARRLGDLAGGTLVVYDRPDVNLESLSANVQRPLPVAVLPMIEMAEKLPLEKLSAADFEILERFLQRRYQLTNTRELSQILLNRLERQMGLEPTAAPDFDIPALLIAILHVQRRGRSEPDPASNPVSAPVEMKFLSDNPEEPPTTENQPTADSNEEIF